MLGCCPANLESHILGPQGPSVQRPAAVVQSTSSSPTRHPGEAKILKSVFTVVETCSFIRVNKKTKKLLTSPKKKKKDCSVKELQSAKFEHRTPVFCHKSPHLAPVNADDTYCKTTVQLLLLLKSCFWHGTTQKKSVEEEKVTVGSTLIGCETPRRSLMLPW